MDNLQKTLERIENTLIDINRRLRTVETVIAELKGRKSMMQTIKDGLILVGVTVAAGVRFSGCSGERNCDVR